MTYLDRPGVRFARDLGRFGDEPALITGDDTLTYRELDERVERRASEFGTTRSLVMIAGSNDVDVIVTYLAALRSGHPVLLAPGENFGHLEGLIDTYRPDVVVRAVDGSSVIEKAGRRPGHHLHPDLALLLSTSGSTGSPKLVRLSHRNVQSNAESIAEYLGIRATDRAVTTLPMHYCYGLSVVHSHLLRGAALILNNSSVTDPDFWELVRAERATTFAGVPYTFDLLDRMGFDQLDLPDLRYITQAGGKMPPERVRKYAELGRRRGWDLFVMYGQTEATARMAYLPSDLAATHPHTIGRPIPGGSFRLETVDDFPSGTGELVYSGPNVMLGYAESPDDLCLGDTLSGELHTGDLARLTDDGLYEVVGRRSRFAKVFGLRIDLQHVESALAQHGLTACCTGGADELVVVVEGGDSDAVRRTAAQTSGLPTSAVRVCLVDQVPRTPTGKPDLRAVAEIAARPELDPSDTVPTTPDVKALFAEILHCSQVDDDSTFVSLGGDSLSYVRMSMRLEAMLGHLPENWHNTPVREFDRGRRSRRGWHRVETNVLLRALAIVLIVGSHIHLFAVLGGAHVLLGIAGYNFARFHLGTADRNERTRRVLRSVARIAVPSMVWIAFAIALTGDYRITSAFLLNGIFGPDGWSAEWRYWFVEAIVYIVLAAVAVLAIPLLDRLERDHSFWFPMGLVGLGLLTRYGLIDIDDSPNRILTASVVFWLFALGWAAAQADTTRQRLCVTAAIVGTVPGFFFGDTQREIIVAIGLCMLVWLSSIPFPAMLSRVAGVLASASLYIYLTHFQVYLPLRDDHPWLAFALSILVGILYWKAVEFVLSLRSRIVHVAALA
ncbi:AMP-binding protein [Rhodococcus sp. IEGM 1401]|uniref:AMP-binding protein n=1 Tax=unclassified Rhodococcus (in: high G+C Gram-positive bacteria) TaxID=192944 RepID=UPI0022B36543|nr:MULTISPECIES: AMP-binding protein [unclassified Rhodococcus (in: high G+C Gram-positive bacteria)]MCZ4563925.1 AMP-binding protein [Rhodococcus sp. IEGM 1401]MDI9924047.1 AMP-binding protein [Rhodococcus sp. IEGM 1372]MDV8036514.1 AMP-binding protein [Rhodococcus sp. IEGM 1414]